MILQLIIYFLCLYLWFRGHTNLIIKDENRDSFKKDGITSEIVHKYSSAILLIGFGFYFILKLFGIIEYDLKIF